MTPGRNPCSSDHSYELPLRRNLLLLLDLLGLLRFIAGVLLDRLGVAPCQGGGELLQLPGLTWGGDDANMERFLMETLWAPAGSPARTGTTRSRTVAVPYLRRRVARPADDEHAGDGAAGCAICLAALEAGGCQTQTVVELGVCSHAFHAACIDAWACSGGEAAATCPLCRAPMLPTAWDDGQSSCHARPGD